MHSASQKPSAGTTFQYLFQAENQLGGGSLEQWLPWRTAQNKFTRNIQLESIDGKRHKRVPRIALQNCYKQNIEIAKHSLELWLLSRTAQPKHPPRNSLRLNLEGAGATIQKASGTPFQYPFWTENWHSTIQPGTVIFIFLFRWERNDVTSHQTFWGTTFHIHPRQETNILQDVQGSPSPLVIFFLIEEELRFEFLDS